jgi:hypothetical protein
MSLRRLLLLLLVGTVIGAILLRIQDSSDTVPVESVALSTVGTYVPACIMVITVYTDGILDVEYC